MVDKFFKDRHTRRVPTRVHRPAHVLQESLVNQASWPQLVEPAQASSDSPQRQTQFVGGGYVRINADFNETFRGDFNTPVRYSDHDPVYVQLTTAANITAQLAIARAGVVYNRTALTATSSVRVTNNTASAISGPLQLVITGLPDGVRLTNAASTSPASAIYNLAAPLAPGQTIIVPLAFSLNAVKAITYSATVFAGGL